MKEAFLHYVWETNSYFSDDWQTREGQTVRVIDPGKRNHDQGPDFLYAKVEIDGMRQYGHVEIHIESQDWYNHGHQHNPDYNAVVLHLVLTHGAGKKGLITRKDGTVIPEVSLNGRIHAGLMQQSTRLDTTGNHPSCGPLLKGMPVAIHTSWLNRVASERLERKLELAQAKLGAFQGDWEQTIWYDLAGFMAGPVNKEAFQTLATHLSIKILRRHQHNPLSREALLFGMACVLVGEPKDLYMESLQLEWKYQSALHQLLPAPVMLKMHRMRPANFPTVRLAQLGVLINHQSRLTELLYPDRLAAFCDKLFQTPDYWQKHLLFGKTSKAAPKKIGYSTLRTILLNCLRPLSILYARAHGDRNWEALSRNVTTTIEPEENRFIRAFKKRGFTPLHAEDGQAMIRLHQEYCQPLRCLECGIGKWILDQSTV